MNADWPSDRGALRAIDLRRKGNIDFSGGSSCRGPRFLRHRSSSSSYSSLCIGSK